MIEPYPVKEWGSIPPDNSSDGGGREKSFCRQIGIPGDPDFVKIPVGQLVSRKYLLNRMSDFNKIELPFTGNNARLPGRICK